MKKPIHTIKQALIFLILNSKFFILLIVIALAVLFVISIEDMIVYISKLELLRDFVKSIFCM